VGRPSRRPAAERRAPGPAKALWAPGGHVFADHPGKVLSRQQLLSMAWGMDFDPQTNLVDVYVGYLRRKLGEPVIETVRGAGYCMSA
jgi:DNA-binding response OmpR family regulator